MLPPVSVRSFVGRRSAEQWLSRTFPDLPPDDLEMLVRRADVERFARGDVVVAEGDPTEGFYVVAKGEAEVSQLVDGAAVYLRTLRAGEVFGEIGLMLGSPRTATVRAVTSLEVVRLGRADFWEVMGSSAAAAADLEALLQSRSARGTARQDKTPLPAWSGPVRQALSHPRAMLYNRLVLGVLLVNLAVALLGRRWWSDADSALPTLALLAQANIALCIMFRQQAFINVLGRVATAAPPTWPLWLRWALAKFYHYGGLHVGTAVAGTAWYLVFAAVLLPQGSAAPVARVVALLVALLLLVIVVLASPWVRHRLHDSFELSHRLGGWAALTLIWVSTVLLEPDLRALGTDPAAWLLFAATLGVAWPWIRLRRVPVDVHTPSDHVALVTLVGEPTPDRGTTRSISRHPLVGWHQFANIPARPGGAGQRMAISRAGDWTSQFIASPPPTVWVRGVPTIELANVWRLFGKTVFVVTGSGIAPVLGHLLDADARTKLVWVTRNPRRTYGDGLVDEILSRQPDASLWDTDTLGKPDVLRLAYAAYVESGAEAVICVSNRTVTWDVVHGLERRGIPAFGPIFDS